jgi:hypothetical protein
MTTQTKTEYLLDRVAERLGVPKPAEGQAFALEPLELLTNLVALLADPAAAKKRIGEFADAAAKANAAGVAAAKAQADADAAVAGLADAKQKQDEKLASELAAHTVEMQRRTREIDGRVQAVEAREREADEQHAKLAADRADLKRRIEAIRAASA